MSKVFELARTLAATSLALLFVSTGASASGGCEQFFANFLQQNFPGSQTLTEGRCQTCHVSPGSTAMNRYVQDWYANGAAGVGSECDQPTDVPLSEVLLAINTLDSDGEGSTNAEELAASTQPGWCNTNGCTNPQGNPPNVQLDPTPTNEPPTANAGGPYSGVAGETLVDFDGSGSSDPENEPLEYAWDFGDSTTGTGVAPSHIYPTAGSYTVTLVVTDGTSESNPDTAAVTITEPVVNVQPVANPGGPYTGEPGMAVTFDGSGSSDANGDALTYAWEFGDGGMGTGVAPTYTFAAAGEYTVSLTVNDGQIDSLIVTTTATIATPPDNSAPVADPGGPYTGTSGVAVDFDGTGSTDPDGDLLTFAWDFGDGSKGTGPDPSHVYAAGLYEVSLVVSDGLLESLPVTAKVEIADAADSGSGAALYASYCAGCHSGPWDGPAVDDTLPGKRRVAGARSCNIEGSIFGTSVFPDGAPGMQFLQMLTSEEIESLAGYLNSETTSGERRYVTTCAGCHGNSAEGGRVGEDVYGESAHETFAAIQEESEMRYMACMPADDIESIAAFLNGYNDDYDDDGILDDDDEDDDNDGVSDEDEYEDGTDPRDEDSDDDGLDDGEEREYGCDPNDADTDNDGNTDGAEVHVLGTDPLVADNVNAQRSSGGGAPGLPMLALLLIAALTRCFHRRTA